MPRHTRRRSPAADRGGATASAAPLAHHFETYEQQREATSLGMWLFLCTEVIFFGGLFLVYLLGRGQWPEAFHAASHHLDVRLGATNTAVLIVSSFTMAMAVRNGQLGRSRGTIGFLLVTMLLGATFLGIKSVEYTHKFHEGIIPGPRMDVSQFGHPEERLFFTLYFIMTGVHALHMLIGIAVLAVLVAKAGRGAFTPENHSPVETAGLYWHFVDIVWIYLFPLLYLLGRSGAAG